MQNQLEIFKNALTIVEQEPQVVVKDNGELLMSMRYAIMENEINEQMKERLNNWVANNLDVKSIMRLFNLREFEDIHRLEDEIKKLKKALKIIAEKEIDVWLLMNCDYENYCRIRTKALETNMQSLDDMNKRESVPLPTIIEFNFVKEMFGK